MSGPLTKEVPAHSSAAGELIFGSSRCDSQGPRMHPLCHSGVRGANSRSLHTPLAHLGSSLLVSPWSSRESSELPR